MGELALCKTKTKQISHFYNLNIVKNQIMGGNFDTLFEGI